MTAGKGTHNAVLWNMAHDKAISEIIGDLTRGTTDTEREVIRRSLKRGDRVKVGRQ